RSTRDALPICTSCSPQTMWAIKRDIIVMEIRVRGGSVLPAAPSPRYWHRAGLVARAGDPATGGGSPLSWEPDDPDTVPGDDSSGCWTCIRSRRGPRGRELHRPEYRC